MAFAAALPGFVMLGGGHSQLAVGGLPPGASLSSVAAVGANTVLLSAEGSAAVWLVHRDHNGRLSLSGCVRPQLQHHCAPSSGSQRLTAAPLVLAGRDVYVADGRHGVLARYRRSGTRLRYVAALHEASLRGALRMVLVNRRRILAVGTDRGSVRLFERGEGGDLTATGCVGGPGSTTCKPLAAQAPGLWMAGAGNWLFTAGGDSITSFSARLRPSRGACVTDAGSEFAEVDSLPGCTFDQHAAGDEFFGMTLFATDSVLYSTDFTTGGIGLGIGWWRIGQSGSLTFGGCLDEGTNEPSSGRCRKGRAAASDAQQFAIDTRQRTLAVGGTPAQGLALLRAAGSGALSMSRGRSACITPHGDEGNPLNPATSGKKPPRVCLADRRVADATGLAFAPSGRVLYVASGHRLLAYGVRG